VFVGFLASQGSAAGAATGICTIWCPCDGAAVPLTRTVCVWLRLFGKELLRLQVGVFKIHDVRFGALVTELLLLSHGLFAFGCAFLAKNYYDYR